VSSQPSDLLAFRIPISDGPDGRVGYMYFAELADGDWRLSMKERGAHEAKTGTNRQAGADAVADALEAFGNIRVQTYNRMRSVLINVPEQRPGFRGNYRQKVMALENVKFHKSRNMLLQTCREVGAKLREYGWPVPAERVLNDGTVLGF